MSIKSRKLAEHAMTSPVFTLERKARNFNLNFKAPEVMKLTQEGFKFYKGTIGLGLLTVRESNIILQEYYQAGGDLPLTNIMGRVLHAGPKHARRPQITPVVDVAVQPGASGKSLKLGILTDSQGKNLDARTRYLDTLCELTGYEGKRDNLLADSVIVAENPNIEAKIATGAVAELQHILPETLEFDRVRALPYMDDLKRAYKQLQPRMTTDA